MEPVGISVITATFNGESTLKRLYISLLEQNYENIEWIVVDDNSNDKTKLVIDKLISKNNLRIIYHYQSHGHKKVAVNNGIRLSTKKLSIIIDDDDFLLPDSFKNINSIWEDLDQAKRDYISGITFHSVDLNGIQIGNNFPYDGMISSEINLRINYNLSGDKICVKRTSLLLENLYPEDVSGYVPETMMWNSIELINPSLFKNMSIRVYDNSRQLYKKSIKGLHKIRTSRGRFRELEVLLGSRNFCFLSKYPFYFSKLSINYIRFLIHALVFHKKTDITIKLRPLSIIFICFNLPLGLCAFLYDFKNIFCELIYKYINLLKRL